MTRTEIEEALDAEKLEVAMANGGWWKARRNGKTKLWKSRPDEFRIPVKAGLRSCGQITHESIPGDHFRVK